jgi:uncharacterized protein
MAGRRLEPRIVETRRTLLKGSMLVVGFPTHGLVGSVAVSYLVHSLEMSPIGHMLSDRFPPTVVMEAGVVQPPVRLYASRQICGVDGKCSQLVAVLSDIQPPPELLNPIGERLLDYAEARGIQLVVALEGQPVEQRSRGDVRVVAMCNSSAVDVLESYRFPRATGLVTGFAGALLLASVGRKLPVLCLVAQAHKSHPDARAAARMLEIIRPMVPMLVIDTMPLKRKAEEIEGELRRNMVQQRASLKELEEPGGGEMYR